MGVSPIIHRIPNINGGYFKVVQKPMGRDYGPVDLNSPRKGCGHTTEGTGEIPNYGNTSPHITVGQRGLYQHRPFGRMAGTLRNKSGGVETNRLFIIQYELVGYSSLTPWLPKSQKQQDMLASLFEWAEQELGVPERHVFPDHLESGVVWAIEQNPRRGKKFPHTPGWYSHNEVPENSHWDKGSFQYTTLMKREPVTTKMKWTIKAVWRDGEDEWQSRELLDKPLSLWRLGKKLASNKSLRNRIKWHRGKKHRLRIVRIKVVE